MGVTDSQNINQLIQVYGICTLFLFIKYMFCMFYGVNLKNHPSEDKLKVPENVTEEDIKRKERTWLNDVENIPFHTSIFWAALLAEIMAISSGEGDKECLGLLCLIVIYTGMRTLFTLLYILAIQPYRSIVFVICQLCVLTTSCILVSCAFKVDAKKIVYLK